MQVGAGHPMYWHLLTLLPALLSVGLALIASEL
jgi:hypothetical protein